MKNTKLVGNTFLILFQPKGAGNPPLLSRTFGSEIVDLRGLFVVAHGFQVELFDLACVVAANFVISKSSSNLGIDPLHSQCPSVRKLQILNQSPRR